MKTLSKFLVAFCISLISLSSFSLTRVTSVKSDLWLMYWADNYNKTYTYDEHDHLVNTMTQHWSAYYNWENYSQINYTNNDDGAVYREVSQSWNSNSTSWDNYSRHTYMYDNFTKNIINDMLELWDGSYWYAYKNSIYTYNSKNQNDTIYTQTWDLSCVERF